MVTGILLYPGFTLLDVAGVQFSLGLQGRTVLFSKTLEPVHSDSGVSLNPTTALRDALPSLDVLFVPGGAGASALLADCEALNFLALAGARSRHLAGVSAGTLLLARAGLLDGYRATTHWALFQTLETLGVELKRKEVVVDRNRWTAGGVAAGIDLGLRLLAELRGEGAAKITQLVMQCDSPFVDSTRVSVSSNAIRAALDIVGDELVLAGRGVAASCE